MKKSFIIIILFLALLALAMPGAALADSGQAAAADPAYPELGLKCVSALLMDGSTGEILYESNADEHRYPASVTKIMTMVLILEAVENGAISLEDIVTVSEDAAAMGGSQVYLYPGETRTVDEMLVAIAVGSGNDASYAMAEFVGGSYSSFIQMMNQRAQELGMTNTHFVNPHGLHDPEHYTSARDLGLLAYHALSVPKLLEYTSIYEYEFRPEPKLLTLWNTNRLLKWYEGTDGMKTGYTSEAGRNLVATAKRNGLRLISVVLGATERNGHYQESMKLMNYGFNSYEYTPLHCAGDIMAAATVSKGAADTVDLILSQDLGYTVRKGEKPAVTESMEILNMLDAPVTAGDICGKVTLYQDGQELVSADLLAAENVAKGSMFRTWGKLLARMW